MQNGEGCTSKVELLLWNTLRHPLNKDLREPRDVCQDVTGNTDLGSRSSSKDSEMECRQLTWWATGGEGDGGRASGEGGERSPRGWGAEWQLHRASHTVVRAWLFTMNHIGCKQNATLWHNLKMFTVRHANKLPGGGWQQGDWVWPSFSSAREVWWGRSLEQWRWEELLFWVDLEGRQQNITTWVCEVKTVTYLCGLSKLALPTQMGKLAWSGTGQSKDRSSSYGRLWMRQVGHTWHFLLWWT